MPAIDPPKLDPREAHFRVPSHHAGLSLFLRYLAPASPTPGPRIVLYVHGATFPSALSIAHRFDGRSWRDELVACGSHTWALDFHGFGAFSDRYPEMGEAAETHPPLGRAADASRQLECAARFICAHHGVSCLSIIAHSWGTIVAGDFAGRCPALVDRMVFFGPIARRPPDATPVRLPAWRLISIRDQWQRFTADVPPHEPPVLSKRHFAVAFAPRWPSSAAPGTACAPTKMPAGCLIR
jgi:pimeloyl-ACP methyl ester carboxylesterase